MENYIILETEVSGWTLRYETKYTSNLKVCYTISWKEGCAEWSVNSTKSSTAVANTFLQRKKAVENPDNSSSSDNDSTEDEVEWVDNKIEDEAEQNFSVLMKSMETLKISKRPLKGSGKFK
ncbi:hypothetical protein C1646_822668 [Rhizophagus diaphanus]|nr:hypothetical protein C1646_822668 [Rhizophagus diaphanus] [Rhizophagus sp. MUCL 43196]